MTRSGCPQRARSRAPRHRLRCLIGINVIRNGDFDHYFKPRLYPSSINPAVWHTARATALRKKKLETLKLRLEEQKRSVTRRRDLDYFEARAAPHRATPAASTDSSTRPGAAAGSGGTGSTSYPTSWPALPAFTSVPDPLDGGCFPSNSVLNHLRGFYHALSRPTRRTPSARHPASHTRPVLPLGQVPVPPLPGVQGRVSQRPLCRPPQ